MRRLNIVQKKVRIKIRTSHDAELLKNQAFFYPVWPEVVDLLYDIRWFHGNSARGGKSSNLVQLTFQSTVIMELGP